MGVLLVGSVVVLVGIVLLFTPGPAIVVIPAGLAILSIEFPALRTVAQRVRETLNRRGAPRRPPAVTPHAQRQAE